eukprot:scaffold3349_cov246-Pinguiococcus_pyrenoidosus.AAC.3
MVARNDGPFFRPRRLRGNEDLCLRKVCSEGASRSIGHCHCAALLLAVRNVTKRRQGKVAADSLEVLLTSATGAPKRSRSRQACLAFSLAHCHSIIIAALWSWPSIVVVCASQVTDKGKGVLLEVQEQTVSLLVRVLHISNSRAFASCTPKSTKLPS